MRFPYLFLALSGALALSTGCGKQSITNAESLPIRTYPKDKTFTITLIMKSCSDVCATYDAPSCSVSVDGQSINLDVEVEFEQNDIAGCSNQCGTPVLAHCQVGALQAGTYTVHAGSFAETITVE